MNWSKDVVELAEQEIKMFERPSIKTAKALIDEVRKLRGLLKLNELDHSHHCRACAANYTPAPKESEDCPKCGSNGDF